MKTSLYNTRKIAVFYLYANAINNSNPIDYFVAKERDIDIEYLHRLISVYDSQNGAIILEKVLKRKQLTVLHIVILTLIVSESSIRVLTRDDIHDYLLMADTYADKFLINLISFCIKTKLVKIA